MSTPVSTLDLSNKDKTLSENISSTLCSKLSENLNFSDQLEKDKSLEEDETDDEDSEGVTTSSNEQTESSENTTSDEEEEEESSEEEQEDANHSNIEQRDTQNAILYS